MRPIKFRAWDKTRKRMQEPSLNMMIDSLMGTAFWQFGYNEPDPMIDTVLMQFTGLLDKNDIEIYESDLLKIDMEKFGVDDAVFQVIWEHDGWALKDLSDDSLPPYIFHDKDRQEVIGNIYENPNLLH